MMNKIKQDRTFWLCLCNVDWLVSGSGNSYIGLSETPEALWQCIVGQQPGQRSSGGNGGFRTTIQIKMALLCRLDRAENRVAG